MATDLWNAVCNDKLEGHDREQQRQHNVDSISEVVLGKRKRGEPMKGNHGNQEAVDALVRRMQWKTHASVTCTSAQVHKCTSTQVHKCTSAQVHKCTSAQVHKYTSAQVHKYTSAQVHETLECEKRELISSRAQKKGQKKAKNTNSQITSSHVLPEQRQHRHDNDDVGDVKKGVSCHYEPHCRRLVTHVAFKTLYRGLVCRPLSKLKSSNVIPDKGRRMSVSQSVSLTQSVSQ